MMSSRHGPVLFVASVWLVGCSLAQCAQLRLFEAVEPHMGTLFQIKLYATTETEAQTAFKAAFDRVGQLDKILSDYKETSELNRLTATAVGREVKASADLFQVLTTAQEIATATDGAFDVTLGPLTHVWRIGRTTGRLPDKATLQQAKEKCGFRKMHLNAERHAVLLDEDGMQLDVGGIAKGYAADEALAIIQSLGIRQALVAASGDLAFSDAPPGKSGWSIGVDAVNAEGQPSRQVLVLSNAAVSTSGESEQHLDSGGRRYSHVIDPRTGLGLTNHLTVTVVARHGIEADALTKVVSVWGREQGLAFLRTRPGVSALIVDRSASATVLSGGLAGGTVVERDF